jgi:hypothetical protein
MLTGETDCFADIPDPAGIDAARAGAAPGLRDAAGVVPAMAAPSEPSPTRGQAARRRTIALVIGGAGAVGLALTLGLRADLVTPEVLAQIGLWSLAVPASLLIALRPRAGGFPPGVSAVRIGLVSLLGLFIGLALMPVDGAHVPLAPRTVRFCLSFGALAGLPALAGAGIVLRRAFLNAPVLRGTLVGAVCGLAGSVSIHAHCPVVTSSHVLLAHGLPIVVFGALGAIFGAFRGRV